MKKIFFLFLFLVIAGFRVVMAPEGKPLPAVVLTNLKGEKVDVSKLPEEKKIIVISFWATWCVPCKKELANMADMYDEWKKNYNVQIVAVSVDDARNSQKVKTFVEGSGWTFDVLLDANQDLKRALNFQNVPYTLLVDGKGNIVYMHNGYVEGDEFLLEEKIKALTGN